jgi:hypothetical protein
MRPYRYITPWLGTKRVDRLTVRDVQMWLNKLPSICRCCIQGKDASRHEDKRHCCTIGQCCHDYPSKRTIKIARATTHLLGARSPPILPLSNYRSANNKGSDAIRPIAHEAIKILLNESIILH